MEQEVMEAVLNNDVVVLCGETGCGKTTQVGGRQEACHVAGGRLAGGCLLAASERPSRPHRRRSGVLAAQGAPGTSCDTRAPDLRPAQGELRHVRPLRART